MTTEEATQPVQMTKSWFESPRKPGAFFALAKKQNPWLKYGKEDVANKIKDNHQHTGVYEKSHGYLSSNLTKVEKAEKYPRGCPVPSLEDLVAFLQTFEKQGSSSKNPELLANLMLGNKIEVPVFRCAYNPDYEQPGAEAEEEEEEEEAEEEEGEEQESEAEKEESEDEAGSESEDERAGVARTLDITAEPNGVCCDQCGACGLWGTDPCPNCGHPGADGAVSEHTDELAVTLPPAKRQKPTNLTEEVSSEWDELEAKLDAIERAAAAAAATEARKAAEQEQAIHAIDEILEELQPRTIQVGASSRTNTEEVDCTAVFLRWLKEKLPDILPHYTIRAGKKTDNRETVIKGPNGIATRKVDLEMIPKDPKKYIHIRIEMKIHDEDKARDQCWNYANWGLPEGTVAAENTYRQWGPSPADTVMHVHALFPCEKNADIKDKFKTGGYGLLHPGNFDTIQFKRSVA